MQKIISDKKKRILYMKNECKYIEYKSMASNHFLSETALRSANNRGLLKKLPRNSFVVRVRNRCIETGRGRSVFRFCKLSRIKLRQRASAAILPGVEKSSW